MPVELQHINVKFFVDGALGPAPEQFINVFHKWIRKEAFDELLVDVADYRHVPEGPGVMLIGLEGDYSMDHTDGRWGLRYNRKAELPGTNADRFSQALRAAATACESLEAEFAADATLRFHREEFELFINDRALAPNTDETFEACREDLDAFLAAALGHDEYSLSRPDDPRRRFGVLVKSQKPFALDRFISTAK